MTGQGETFTFINLSEPKEAMNEDLRKSVRSNAMRSYRRKQKQKAGKLSMPEASYIVQPSINDHLHLLTVASRQLGTREQSLSEQACHDGAEKYQSQSLNAPASVQSISVCVDGERKEDQDRRLATGRVQSIPGTQRLLSPKNLSGGGLDDLFDAYPIRGDPRYVSRMLSHFRFWAKRLFPFEPCDGQDPLTTIWLPNAMQDPLLFLATLNFAAVHQDALYGIHNRRTTLVHKAETIRLIKARLESPTEAVENTTMGAVAMLAATEGLSRDFKDLRVHMSAISWMVKKRGGLGKLGWSGVLQIVISWQDLRHSAMVASPPYFAHHPSYQAIDLSDSHVAQSNADFNNTTSLCNMITTILRDIRYLSDFLASRNRSSSMNDLMSFYNQRSALELRLNSLLIRKPKGSMKLIDYTLEAYRIAALIYVQYVMYNAVPSCPTIQNLKTQLINLILETGGEIVDDDTRLQHGSATWILFMVGILYRNDDEKEYFAQAIARATRGWWSLSGAKTWEDMEACLKEIAWGDYLRTAQCASLWKRVEGLSDRNPSE